RAGQRRPGRHPEALARLPGRLRAQVHRRLPAGGLARPVAAGPELRARRGDPAARQDRRRLHAVRASRHPVRSVVICSILTNYGAESLPGRIGTRHGAACTAIMSRIRLAVTMLVAGAALVAAPLPANHGYCVFTFNYGGSSASSVVQGTGDIAASAGQLASFVTRVRAATGAAKVDLVGHSQGGMMPRYYLKFLGGAALVNRLVA